MLFKLNTQAALRIAEYAADNYVRALAADFSAQAEEISKAQALKALLDYATCCVGSRFHLNRDLTEAYYSALNLYRDAVGYKLDKISLSELDRMIAETWEALKPNSKLPETKRFRFNVTAYFDKEVIIEAENIDKAWDILNDGYMYDLTFCLDDERPDDREASLIDVE